MVSHKSLLKSVSLAFTAVLLMGTSACTYSRSVNKNFALSPEGEVTDGADTIVDGGNNTVAEDDAGSDTTITPTSPTTPSAPDSGNTSGDTASGNPTPAQEEPASEPPTDGTPPVTPTPAGDTCHRIAYASKEDGPRNHVFVGNDCVDGEKIDIPQDLIADATVHLHNEAPTFSSDGQNLTTYLTSWVTNQTESIKSQVSIWHIENGFPLLKDTSDGDHNGDGLTDSIQLSFLQDPIENGGQLSLSASMPVCRNGIIEGFEVCDDGNQVDTDTCSNTCQPVGTHTVPSTPKFLKSLVYTKKSGPGGLAVLKEIVENEMSLGQAAFTHEGSVIFSGAILGDSESNLYAFDLEAGVTAPVRIPGLSEAGVSEDQPAVSPDGTKIIYNRNSEIWTCDLVFTRLLPTNEKGYHCVHQTKISNGIFDGIRNSAPCFSHDGNYVFFLSRVAHGTNGQENDAEVWRVNADGTNPVNISNNDSDEESLSCSPAAGPTGVLK